MCLTLMWHLRLSFLVNESEQNGHLSIWGKWLIRWCQRLVTVFPQRRHMKWTEEARWNNVSYSSDTLPDPRPNPTPATDPQFVLFLCSGLGLHTVHSCVYKMFTRHYLTCCCSTIQQTTFLILFIIFLIFLKTNSVIDLQIF